MNKTIKLAVAGAVLSAASMANAGISDNTWSKPERSSFSASSPRSDFS